MSNKSNQNQEVRIVFRSSISGEFVKPDYAKRHPSTTEKQHIKRNRSKK